MPEIQLSQKTRFRLELITHCVWPDNKDKRDAYVALFNKRSVEALKEFRSKSRVKPIYEANYFDARTNEIVQIHRYNSVDEYEVERAIAKGFGLDMLHKDINRSIGNMVLAGYVTAVLASMTGNHRDDERLRFGPGIKKAQEVVADIQNLSITKIETAWQKYSTVAHFLAAAIGMPNNGMSDGRIMIKHLYSPTVGVIAISECYRLFLTTFIPHSRQVPIVDERDIWFLPDYSKIPKEFYYGLAPLPEKIMKKLANRVARSRKSG